MPGLDDFCKGMIKVSGILQTFEDLLENGDLLEEDLAEVTTSAPILNLASNTLSLSDEGQKGLKRKGDGQVSGSSQVYRKKPKGKCYKCKQKGHWKVDCPKNVEDTHSTLITRTCLVASSTYSWVVHTSTIDHVCYTL